MKGLRNLLTKVELEAFTWSHLNLHGAGSDLPQLGHEVGQRTPPLTVRAALGGVQAVRIELPHNTLEGASDQRKDGAAMGYGPPGLVWVKAAPVRNTRSLNSSVGFGVAEVQGHIAPACLWRQESVGTAAEEPGEIQRAAPRVLAGQTDGCAAWMIMSLKSQEQIEYYIGWLIFHIK